MIPSHHCHAMQLTLIDPGVSVDSLGNHVVGFSNNLPYSELGIFAWIALRSPDHSNIAQSLIASDFTDV